MELFVVLDWFCADLPEHGTYGVVPTSLPWEEILSLLHRLELQLPMSNKINSAFPLQAEMASMAPIAGAQYRKSPRRPTV
jgi:hypothetical protein